MRYIIILISLGLLVGCQNLRKPVGESDVATSGHDHKAHIDHEGHDHDAHDHGDDKAHVGHEAHDHDDHDAHDHGDDKAHEGHEGHDHDAQDAHDHGDDKAHEGHEGHDHGATEQETHNPDEIVFPVSQQKITDFEVAKVARGVFNDVIRGWGEVLPAQGAEHQIVAPSNGVVGYGGVSLALGVAVAQGQKIFTVSSKNIASGDLLERNKANYDRAKSDYDRAKELIGERIISQSEFNLIEQGYREAKTEYEALGGDGAKGAIVVASPISGHITAINVGAGEYVEMGQVLGRVSQSRSLTLRAEVALKYYPRLKDVVSANFKTTYDDKTYQLSQLNGRLLSVGRSVEQGGAFIPVTFQFNNMGEVISGTFVEVALLGRERSDVIALPVGAVTEQQGTYYVYEQLEPEIFMKREVKIGGNDGVRVEIVRGLDGGENVVTKGAVSVKMASFSAAIPHTHEH